MPNIFDVAPVSLNSVCAFEHPPSESLSTLELDIKEKSCRLCALNKESVCSGEFGGEKLQKCGSIPVSPSKKRNERRLAHLGDFNKRHEGTLQKPPLNSSSTRQVLRMKSKLKHRDTAPQSKSYASNEKSNSRDLNLIAEFPFSEANNADPSDNCRQNDTMNFDNSSSRTDLFGKFYWKPKFKQNAAMKSTSGNEILSQMLKGPKVEIFDEDPTGRLPSTKRIKNMFGESTRAENANATAPLATTMLTSPQVVSASRLTSKLAKPIENHHRGPGSKTTTSSSRGFKLPPRQTKCNLVAFVVILFYCLLECRLNCQSSGSILLTSANELFASEPLPEAQPFVYMLHEMGSGEGSRSPSYSRSSSQSSGSDQTSSSTTDADVAPVLIEARCWNNYENDNDCKQLNVITAPQSERQNQQQQTGEDDNLITPVVIFEASSSIETTLDHEMESERPLFMAPPYQPNEIPTLRTPANTRKPLKHYEQSSTSNPTELYAATPRQLETNFEPPATRPTVIHFVATPQPKSSDGASRRPHTKVTTQGRRCRDENDADCDDEDEDNQIKPSGHQSPSQSTADNDEKDDEDDDENENDDQELESNKNGRVKSTSATRGGGGGDQTNLINESGSGLGPGGGGTVDDNDDSTDDGDEDSTGNSSESSGSSSIQENSSRASDNQLLMITSSYSQSQLESNSDYPHSSTTNFSVAPHTGRPQSGAAEIEVVVHSTLPPSFPVNIIGQERSRSKAAYDEFVAMISTTTTTTTMMPDEIYTSKPIFPSSTFTPVNSLDGEQRSTGANQAGQTTTELDLYTFKPVPIPLEQSEIRPSRFEFGGQTSGTSDSNNRQGEQDGHETGQAKHEVSSQHIHEPPGHRRPFDDGWTTRKPLGSMVNLGKDQFNQQNQSPDIFPNSNRVVAKSYNYMTTETLPTMLLYASIIVTVFISLILVVIYSLWRRNSLRRRALLAKAHMMNGRPPAGMIESMSHVSHLMHGADGLSPQQQPPPSQQGLMSTYARAKGSAIGKVTTSLVKPIDQSAGSLLGQELEEEDEDQQAFKDESRDQLVIEEENSSLEENQNQQQMRASRLTEGINDGIQNRSGSWSTEDPTTTTSSGSQQTQDSQHPASNRGAQQGAPMQNGQRLHHPYPNSLSDGRQNSSSISDSQCSPDPQPSSNLAMNPMHHQPLAMSSNQTHSQSPMHNNQPIDHREIVAASPLHLVGGHHQQPPYVHYPKPQLQQPFIRPILRPPPQQHGNGLQRMFSVGPGPMSPAGQTHNPMLVQNGGAKGLRQRLVASRSIEDVTLSQHVGFVDSNNNQNQLPYNQHQQVLPQLIQARPNYQYPNQQIINMNASSAIRNSMISPQRIAMSPLATLSRRFPPGAALNRNIYSEDSSSFMTASPSLARTSSSSSFAFNLSNLPTPSSIKARPIVDPSGRVFNDYTHGLNDQSNSIGNGNGPTVPPAFGRADRSEAWYV